jgi:low affinity Fe/Cu permease
MNEIFHKFARTAATVTGSAWAFIGAVIVIVIWLISGPVFKFSDTWQLFINTGTTILTFLMVFLIQNTQNRDAFAMHLKLDELILAVEKARNNLVDLEDLSDAELANLQKEFARLSKAETDTVNALEEKKERQA